MHESALVAAVMKIVVEEARRYKVSRITRVRLASGVLTAVEPQTLQGCFELFAEGTVAEGAELVLDLIPARAHCTHCGHNFDISSPHVACPQCGGIALEVSGGHEFNIIALEAAENHAAVPDNPTS